MEMATDRLAEILDFKPWYLAYADDVVFACPHN